MCVSAKLTGNRTGCSPYQSCFKDLNIHSKLFGFGLHKNVPVPTSSDWFYWCRYPILYVLTFRLANTCLLIKLQNSRFKILNQPHYIICFKINHKKGELIFFRTVLAVAIGHDKNNPTIKFKTTIPDVLIHKIHMLSLTYQA